MTCAIAVDRNDVAYVAGQTRSNDFFTTYDAYDRHFDGFDCPGTTDDPPSACMDGFLLKLNSPGTQYSYSSFIGGSSGDRVLAMALDRRNNVYLAGNTDSADFPTTTNALYREYDAGGDAFITVLSTVANYTISGAVRDQAGVAVSGVVVSDGAGQSVTTAADGTYTLRGMLAGAYTLVATKPGYRTAPLSPRVSVPPNTTQHFTIYPTTVYVPLIAKIPPGPQPTPTRTPPPTSIPSPTPTPPPPCDMYEPNDDRTGILPQLSSGQTIQAKICEDEGSFIHPDHEKGVRQDNYAIELARNGRIEVTVELPLALLNDATALMIYKPTDLSKPFGTCYEPYVPEGAFTMFCDVPTDGKYIIRLYTHAQQFDNANIYTLKVVHP